MLIIPDIKDKNYMVMGLGRSGTSAALSLQASGAQVWAWDDDAQNRFQALGQGINVRAVLDDEWPSMTALVLNPGIPDTYPQPHISAIQARKVGIPIVCDVNFLSCAQPQAQFIGITGTNGKSTTTALIGHLLNSAGRDCQVGGNIGIAALSLNPFEDQTLSTFVLELSSYQLERVPDLGLDHAVLLNIAPDHLSRHGGLAGYIAAKKNIFNRLKSNGMAFVGIDDVESESISRELKKHHPVVTFSGSRPADIYVKDQILYENEERIVDLTQASPLKGDHNAQNIAAAYGVARSLGLDKNVLIKGIQTFQGLPHRLEYLGNIEGVDFVNDSKATNPEAVAKALACYDDIYWIVGGQAKDNGLEGLEKFYTKIKHAFLIGESSSLFAGQLADKVSYTRCETLEKATATAFDMARKNRPDLSHKNVILLSPACASWDQFNSFEHRGDVFRNLFINLIQNFKREDF
ncbi:MAG: UDP-N-acetylmuramoyl-L-alanine--D-glutamate ligase [Janthinobacterium lividum]